MHPAESADFVYDKNGTATLTCRSRPSYCLTPRHMTGAQRQLFAFGGRMAPTSRPVQPDGHPRLL